MKPAFDYHKLSPREIDPLYHTAMLSRHYQSPSVIYQQQFDFPMHIKLERTLPVDPMEQFLSAGGSSARQANVPPLALHKLNRSFSPMHKLNTFR